MKISTKFIGVSMFLVGAIAFGSGGSTIWRNQAEQASLLKYTQAKQRMQLATQARADLRSSINHLKDDLLFRREPATPKHQGNREFEQSIKTLTSQLPSLEVDLVLQRYEIYKQLEQRLRASLNKPSPTVLADNQRDFRAINSFGRDVDFCLEKIIREADQDAQQAEQQLKQVGVISSFLSYATVIFLMLIVAGEFWLILLPIINSLKQLQKGAGEIGAGNLSHRLAISTQDEIEQVAQAFNQMAENLTQSQLQQQKLVELEVARTAAETANRTKSEFLANMNHELRTPLNGILGYTQILQRDPATTTKQMKGLGVIHQCASHLLTLINDILDLSKLEVQKMELYPQDFHLANFLSSTVDICCIKAEQKGVKFLYQPAANLPTAVHADDKRLRQVLLNLLSNAVKFTDFGTVSFRVEAVNNRTVLNNTHRVCFQVKDTGIGIAPEKLSTIFLPFEQAAKRERNTEGTGLGLAISQQIVEKMGSTIHVKSVLGQGSCFWFEVDLPLASDWTVGQVADQKIIVATTEEAVDIVIPPPTELVAIYAALEGGFITDVQKEAHRIKELAPEYVNFANRVLELSQKFDDEAILRLLETAV